MFKCIIVTCLHFTYLQISVYIFVYISFYKVLFDSFIFNLSEFYIHACCFLIFQYKYFIQGCISLQKVYAQFLILYTTCYHSRHCGYALTTSMCESRIFFPRDNNYVCSCRDGDKKAYFWYFYYQNLITGSLNFLIFLPPPPTPPQICTLQ